MRFLGEQKKILLTYLDFKAACRLLDATLVEITDQEETDVVSDFVNGMLLFKTVCLFQDY